MKGTSTVLTMKYYLAKLIIYDVEENVVVLLKYATTVLVEIRALLVLNIPALHSRFSCYWFINSNL